MTYFITFQSSDSAEFVYQTKAELFQQRKKKRERETETVHVIYHS